MSRSLLAICAAVTVSACFSPTVETEPSTEGSTTISEEIRNCHVGAFCSADNDCCASNFCDLSSYAPTRCAARRGNGAYCFNDNQCKSHICSNAVCAAKACAAPAAVCAKDADCCSGNFCDQTGYGTSKCRALRANGAYCSAGTQCQTGTCLNGACAAACASTGSTCTSDPDCCAGTFCNNLTYAAWKCIAPKADGAYCTAGNQCKSGSCQSSVCTSACVSIGAACGADPDCCAGTFCNTLTYAPSKCAAPQPNGDYCQADAQCQSGSCKSGSCAAAVCGNAGTACVNSVDCCAGTFCFNYTYAPWVCKSAFATGASCNQNAQCLSANCVASKCAAAVCANAGATCQGDSDCCSSSYCLTPFSYVPLPSLCTSRVANGAYCNAHRECTSLNCVNHACAP